MKNKKPNNKRLAVNKQTLVVLTNKQLAPIAGGGLTYGATHCTFVPDSAWVASACWLMCPAR